MRTVLSLASFVLLALFASANAQTPVDENTVFRPTWTCTISEDTNTGNYVRTCTCQGVANCAAMAANRDCTSEGVTKDFNSTGGSCTGPAREASLDPRQQLNPDSGQVMTAPAPTNTEPSPVPPIAIPLPHAQMRQATDESAGNEVVPSRRGAPSPSSNSTETIVAPNNIIAPNNIVAPNNVVPPRENSQIGRRRPSEQNPSDGSGDTLSFDEADALFGANPPAAGEGQSEIVAPNNRSEDRRSETVRTRRATSADDGENDRRNEIVPARRGGLAAPSDLTVSGLRRTALTLAWHDNARGEFGVSVERGTPTEARGGINFNWQHVFNVEERVESRQLGTGMRSDGDDGLTPSTEYCYRLRAYRDDAYSDYSATYCTLTPH
jgi:hypothetical protein